MLKTVFIIALAILCIVSSERVRYDDYHLIQLEPQNDDHLRIIAEMKQNNDFDVWNEAPGQGQQVQVLLSPSAYYKYGRQLIAAGIQFTVLNPNIQRDMDVEAFSMFASRFLQQQQQDDADKATTVVGKFARHADINAWLSELAVARKELVTIRDIGRSWEGRDLRLIKIKSGQPKKKVFFECGIHAREWLSVSSCVYLIDTLINKQNEADVSALLAYYEFWIVPVANPDGYEHAHTSNRLWRKNRRTNSNKNCYGVDLNRNYPFQWMYAGASSNPCDDTYAGQSAASEPEVQAIIKTIEGEKDWDVVFAVHTYGRWLLVPYGYTYPAVYPDNYDAMLAAAKIAATELNKYESAKFTVGNSAALLYAAAGATDDFAIGKKLARFAYTFELTGGSFIQPESTIPKTGQGFYEGVKAMLNWIKQNYP